jgi:DNA-binding transcriptional regulator YiaG
MSAVVKMRHIEPDAGSVRQGVILRFRPKTPVKVIKHIEREYGDYLMHDDAENYFSTDIYRKSAERLTPRRRITEFREIHGMTQTELACMLGMAVQKVHDFEHGHRGISKATAKKLEKIFNSPAGNFI